MKASSPQLVWLRPYPTAVLAVTVGTAAATAAVASRTGTSTPLAWVALAATAALSAALGTLLWPRLATDVFRLHGTSFPSIPDGGDLPLLGRVLQMVAASAGLALCHQYKRWQEAVGWGVNYQYYLFASRVVVLVNPEDVRAVAVKAVAPRDPWLLRHFGTPISPGVLFLLGEPLHSRTRRLVHPFLSGAPTAEVVLRVVNGELGAPTPADANGSGGAPVGVPATATVAATGGTPPRWAERLDALAASGEAVDVDELMTAFTLDVMHNLLFSEPLPADAVASTMREFYTLIKDSTSLGGIPIPDVLAAPTMRRMRAAGERYVAYAAEREAARRAAYADGSAKPSPPRDMLDIMLADLDNPKGAYEGDRRRVAADLLFYQLAGYDTTAHSIAWTIHALCDHPEVEARLLAELDAALPPPGVPLTAAHLAGLPYTDAVCKESLRAFPPAPLGTVRKLEADLRLPSDGSVIPAQTVVMLPVYPLHQNPHAYPGPEVFDPARWLPAAAAGGAGGSAGGGAGGAAYTPATQRAARAHFSTFSSGPLACPGQNMAAMEAKAVLAVLLRRFRFSRVGRSEAVVLENSMTLRPAGFRVTLHRREAA